MAGKQYGSMMAHPNSPGSSSFQTHEDTILLHHLNKHLSNASLPPLTHILGTTPSLLISLYESLPPSTRHRRIPFVDRTATAISSFSARLRNLKLLVGGLAHDAGDLLGQGRLRRRVEELDLRGVCEYRIEDVREVVKVMVEVADRAWRRYGGIKKSEGVEVGRNTSGNVMRVMQGTTEDKLNISSKLRDRLPGIGEEIDTLLRGSLNPENHADPTWPPSTGTSSKTDDESYDNSENFASNNGQEGEERGHEDRLSNPKRSTSKLQPNASNSYSHNSILIYQQGLPSPVSSNTSSISSSFLEQISARVNAIVARCPPRLPSPQNKYICKNSRINSKNSGRKAGRRKAGRRICRDCFRNPSGGKKGDFERLEDQEPGDTGPSPFLSVLPSTIVFSSAKKCRISRGRESRLGNSKGAKHHTSLGSCLGDEEVDDTQWTTEDEFIESNKTSLEEENDIGRRRLQLPSGDGVVGAIYVPLPLSRPSSIISNHSLQEQQTLSSSPPPRPRPRPPLPLYRIKTQVLSSPKRQYIKLRAPPTRCSQRRKVPRKSTVCFPKPARHAKAPQKSAIATTKPNQKPPSPASDDYEYTTVSSTCSSSSISVSSSPPKQTLQKPTAQISCHRRHGQPIEQEIPHINISSSSSNNNKHYKKPELREDSDSDRTTQYSVSTVSWGPDDPLTAALRRRRQVAMKRLQTARKLETKRSVKNNNVHNALLLRGERDILSSRKESGRTQRPIAGTRGEGHRVQNKELADTDTDDTDTGLTDVEEELNIMEGIRRKEVEKQRVLLKRLQIRERGKSIAGRRKIDVDV